MLSAGLKNLLVITVILQSVGVISERAELYPEEYKSGRGRAWHLLRSHSSEGRDASLSSNFLVNPNRFFTRSSYEDVSPNAKHNIALHYFFSSTDHPSRSDYR